jgi:hypothetical protein
MYVNPNPYALSETMQMHDHCRHCGLRYKIEPNFFFGAMYVSYALAVALCIAVFVIAHFFLNQTVLRSFLAIFVILILLMPWVTRVSRNIYINLFIHYDPQAAKGNDAG